MQEPINNQSMLRVGTILRGIYRIDRYLSSGGFGNTYVASNIEFNETVAIKEFFMKGVTQRDDNQTSVSVSNTENRNSFLEQREKFKKEARRLRQLNNSHIVRVHDLFEENGTAYYVMDYVDGENLSERLKRTGQPMTEAEVNEMLPQVLDALKTVHDAGIWHLDLKPANIMVDKNGNVKLIDFGASKQLNAQKGGATTSTAISYTNGYAPREQMEQNYDKFGPWTDLYALGATIFNLLTNKRPPLPTDIDDDMSEDKHLALPMPNVSDSMKKLILWLMQTNRMKRPQSIESILAELYTLKVEESNGAKEYKGEMVISKQQANYPEETEDTIIEVAENDMTVSTNEYRGEKDNKSIIGILVVIGMGIIGVIVFITGWGLHEIKNNDINPQYIERADTMLSPMINPEVMPSFPGGDEALRQFLTDNIIYPEEAINKGIEGRVVLQFVVETNGTISEINVVNSIDPLLDREAIRVVKSMPKWIPGMQDSCFVRACYTLAAVFRIE